MRYFLYYISKVQDVKFFVLCHLSFVICLYALRTTHYGYNANVADSYRKLTAES